MHACGPVPPRHGKAAPLVRRSEEPEGGEKRKGESQPPPPVFHRLHFIAAGVRRPAWGLHHIARPPPHLCSRE
jgi:hypothetical protein